MKKEQHISSERDSLREKAEKRLKKDYLSNAASFSDRTSRTEHSQTEHPDRQLLNDSSDEYNNLKLLHELQVHQIELEMQNEELRNAEEKATLNAEKYTALYDFAPAGYFTLSYDGTIDGLNLSGASMLCKERSHLVHSNFRLFVAQEALLDFDDFLQKIFESKSRNTCELQLKVNGDLSVFVYLEGIVSEDEQKCLVTAIDITKRKLAEKALEENEARLRELNATKDKLFSIIAHDLKGPFNSILGFSDLLADQIKRNDVEKIERSVMIIQKSSQRAMDLLMNLLEWSRLQTGRIEFNPEPVEIVTLINEVTELLNFAAQQKSITISSELTEKVPVSADRLMIGTVLRNLISNAIKFTHPGGEIVISTDNKNDELMVTVADNGVGIKEEALDKLFRIDENYVTLGTQKEKGTGLGLILCKEFVLKHGGKIWVESHPYNRWEGKGCKFCFTIPKR